jgi:hypothetical protein
MKLIKSTLALIVAGFVGLLTNSAGLGLLAFALVAVATQYGLNEDR